MAAEASAFARKKADILTSLARPPSEYADASPKGSIDAPIRALVDEINGYDGLVTTSSCSGRVSVFVDGRGTHGGKGHGGKWLFVSHDSLPSPSSTQNELMLEPITIPPRATWHELFDLATANSAGSSGTTGELDVPDSESTRYIHFKFEPLILHVLTAGAAQANRLLACALQAGFRESGASNVPFEQGGSHDATINVAIRTTGLAFDNIIGYCSGSDGLGTEKHVSLVTESHLAVLIAISNRKFQANAERLERLRSLLRDRFGAVNEVGIAHVPAWEDADVRRQRKRAEGLRRQQALRGQPSARDPAQPDCD